MTRLFLIALVTGVAVSLPAQTAKPDDGFRPLFNGTDLTGWVNVNCHPDTFFVKDGEIITTGKPTGFLRTDRQYENFVLEMDWMHVNKTEVGNSGLFVWGDPIPAVGTPYTRGIEVQVLVNLEYKNKDGKVTASSHGDLFSIWGAKCVPDRPHPNGSERCLPSEYRAKGGGEWNHYKVTANDGVIKLEVNGKEVSGVSKCNPRKGYLALESEGAECRFKNIKIKELPSTNPKPEETSKTDEGFKSLFNGLNSKGWTELTRTGQPPEMLAWSVSGGRIKCDGDIDAGSFWTEKQFTRYELIYDFKLPEKAVSSIISLPGDVNFQVVPKGKINSSRTGAANEWLDGNSISFTLLTPDQLPKPGSWIRVTVGCDGKALTGEINGHQVISAAAKKAPPEGPFRFAPAKGLEIMNIFVRELKEEKK